MTVMPFLLFLLAAEKVSAGLNLKYGGVALGMLILSIGLIRWSIRTYLESSGITAVKGLRSPRMSPQFRMLQEMGMATGEQLTGMAAADRERLFAEAMIRRVAPNPSAAPAAGGAAAGALGIELAAAAGIMGARSVPAPAPPPLTTAFRVSCSPDHLFCPACGATLGDRRTPIGYLTSCLTCKRVLKARLEGARVTIEAAGS